MPSTQSPYDLKLASMQTPEAIAMVSFTLKESEQEVAANTLLLHPGKPGKIAMELKNMSGQSFNWWMEVEGDFPREWCHWEPEAPRELEEQETCDRAVQFQVPINFFEDLQALHPGQPRLNLDYGIQISIYAERNEERRLIGYRVFTLQVRPDTSYLKYLPALYREVDFVGRLLAIFEQTFDPAVQTLNGLWAYLDPLTAPEAFLPFLAHWVAWDVDDRWTIAQQRRLIKNAVALYRWHGTRQGLRFYLHLYTGLPLDNHIDQEVDKHIGIDEVFSAGFVMNQTRIGEDSMLGGGIPYHFIVRLRPERAEVLNETLIREIIESQKPAFCTYELQIIPTQG